MTDFKARLSTVQRGLDEALGKANAFQDPSLSPEGLQAKRTELAKAARGAAGPQLAALRAEVAATAQTSADKASAALPKAGTNADATARISVKWAQVALRLDAGMPMHAIIAGADVDTLHAVAEFGPSYLEAKAYRAPTVGEALHPGPAVDHSSALRRSVDERLAGLSGKGAVSALTESRAAAGEAAYLAVAGRRLDSLIAGTPAPSSLATAIAAEHAEQLAVNGQAPADAGADAGAAADGGA